MRILLLSLVLAACSDHDDLFCEPFDPSCVATSPAQKKFEIDVHPTLTALCSGCHLRTEPTALASGFVDKDIRTARKTVLGIRAVVADLVPNNAPLLRRITDPIADPNHVALEYSNDQIADIVEWMRLERAMQGNASVDESEVERALRDWSGCLSFADFEAANMGAWANVRSNGDGACRTCHQTGDYGFIAATDPAVLFAFVTEDRFHLLQYFDVDLAVSPPQVKPHTRGFEHVAERQHPHQQHPNFPTDNAGMVALQAWSDAARAQSHASLCGPPKLLN